MLSSIPSLAPPLYVPTCYYIIRYSSAALRALKPWNLFHAMKKNQQIYSECRSAPIIHANKDLIPNRLLLVITVSRSWTLSWSTLFSTPTCYFAICGRRYYIPHSRLFLLFFGFIASYFLTKLSLSILNFLWMRAVF